MCEWLSRAFSVISAHIAAREPCLVSTSGGHISLEWQQLRHGQVRAGPGLCVVGERKHHGGQPDERGILEQVEHYGVSEGREPYVGKHLSFLVTAVRSP